MTQAPRPYLPAVLLAGLLALLPLWIAACSSGGDTAGSSSSAVESTAPTFQKVTPSDHTYAVDDLRAFGMKANLQYDVEGLPNAIDAWRCIYQQKEYEARFYASYEDAVEHGTGPADEVTGPDAILFGDAVSWQPGANNRKICGHKTYGSAANAGCDAKFGDYAIYGNLVLLCEGENPEESLPRCNTALQNLQ